MTLAGALLAALLLPIPIGAAEAAPEASLTKARLEVRAAPECTSYADLSARVAARSPRIHFVDQAALYAQVILTAPEPGSVLAELVLSAADGKPAPRRVAARSCAEAADAVALIIAVTLDPASARKPATGPVRDPGAITDGEAVSRVASATKAGSPSPSEPKDQPAEQTVTDQPAERPDIAKPPAEPAAVVSVPPPPAGPSATTRYGFGAHLAGQVVIGPAPAVMPGVALYALAAIDRDGTWAPAIILGALHAWRSDLAELGSTASFALDAGSLDACPLRLRWSSLVARPCASLLVGRMTASGGADVSEAASTERPFVVAGGVVVLTAGIGSVVELTGRLSTGATLIRDSYGFRPTVFHRASFLTTSASVGLGIRWP
jgi:hypothetical protein